MPGKKERKIKELIVDIKERLETQMVIIMGDWSSTKQMKHYMPTPMVGLKRKLKERFKVYNIDEYRTSKLNYKTEEENENLKLLINGKERELNPVLTYKMKTA